jgi:prepilin-type N-terminal cleavage/methylation domain-containing protein
MNRRTPGSGFTLVEVVISVMLLALVLGTAYPVLTRGGAIVRQARNHYLAVNVAKARVERARNFEYGDLHLLAEPATEVDQNGVPTQPGVFRRTTTVTPETAPGLTLVTVSVEMRDMKSGLFQGEHESVSCAYTDYLER